MQSIIQIILQSVLLNCFNPVGKTENNSLFIFLLRGLPAPHLIASWFAFNKSSVSEATTSILIAIAFMTLYLRSLLFSSQFSQAPSDAFWPLAASILVKNKTKQKHHMLRGKKVNK